MKKSVNDDAKKPINQLNLYGYQNHFIFFTELFKINKLPNIILLSGQKGSGKATFAYHFINFLLSKNENNTYDIHNFSINPENSSYKLIQNHIHSNLFTIDANDDGNIKIEEIRKLLLFLNKSTYKMDLKIVLIDNAEHLNLSSSNSLLKSIEEPHTNTFFFIINNDFKKIIPTIKSRCIEFKFNFSTKEKNEIFNKIINQYDLVLPDSEIQNFLSFDSHGNLLKYLLFLKNSDINLTDNYLSQISYLSDRFTSKGESKILDFLKLLIQVSYTKLSLQNNLYINNYYRNLTKILNIIKDMNNFHLDKKNMIYTIDKIIKNDH